MSNVVDLVYIIDRSGSMIGLIKDAVGGFNAYVAAQKAVPGEAYLTLIAFDDKYDIIHDRVLLDTVPELAVEAVWPRGTTALLDAVGKTIGRFDPSWRVTFNIMTDGYENASSEFTTESLKTLVEERTQGGWEFNFVGAGIINFNEARAMGFKATNIQQVAANQTGIAAYTKGFTAASTKYRIG